MTNDVYSLKLHKYSNNPISFMHYIQTYYRRLDDLRRIAGASNEGSLRPAFEELLKNIGEEHQLILCPEYPFEPFKPMVKKTKLRADGVLIDRLRLVHGWWEAKDEKDDLDKEIIAKLDKGYPSDNIIFEDTQRAILLQQGQEVVRCDVLEVKPFQRLLDAFFDYELPEVHNFRLARDKFLTELPQVAQALTHLLAEAHQNNRDFHQQAEVFLQLCQRSIGKQVSDRHVDEMLIQHILTDQIFRAVFPDSNFHQENHLAVAIGQLEKCFFRGETRANLLKRLEPYFAAIRQAAANTITSHEKQTFLKQVYEDFYSAYNAKDADKLGIVYTPQEAVRFIIEGRDWLTQVHFDKRLIDSGLEILDPCTGTGTFVVDLLDYWRGQKDALVYKFSHEVHANEVSILSYYIACLNIEQSFHEITDKWLEFEGLCFVNTLDNVGFEQMHEGAMNDMFGGVTDENHLRIQEQNKRRIPVIIGNPPYNANQQNENDNNKNDAAVFIDKRIKDTYLSESSAQKTKLYDPYIRFFRWASDRLGEQGILGFITNRSYVDKRSFDGFRKIVAQEFQEIWVVDLLGDLREKSETSLNQGGNIFNIQTGVAIGFFVRNPNVSGCEIHYIHAPEGSTGIEKLRWLKSNYLQKLSKTGQFEQIKPNEQGLWLNQPTVDWSEWVRVAAKEVKAGKSEEAIFKLFSLGLSTNRDEWLYGVTANDVANKVQYFIDSYEKLRLGKCAEDVGIKWSRNLKRRFASGKNEKFSKDLIQTVLYRPYIKRNLYRSQLLIDESGSNNVIFPIKNDISCENFVICFSIAKRSKNFSCYATSLSPSLDIFLPDANNYLPLYQYSADGTRQENITDWALNQFREHYSEAEFTELKNAQNKNVRNIEKLEIFHYVYAVLHDPRYRETFALNLKQEFPRIPFYPEFEKWAEIGKQLMDLHINFEHVQPYPLARIDAKIKTTPKCKLKADKTNNMIEIDNYTRLENIPPNAWDYQLGNRSALEWILDQYKEKKPRDPTIREKFNTYQFNDYKEQVIELLGKVCHVSVETMKLIEKIKTLKI